MFSGLKLFAHLGDLFEAEESGGAVTPTNAYVAENGATFYVAEDGATYYVKEM